MLVRSNASAFLKQILCEKASNRPGSRFFGEAFVAATTAHDEGWYGSFKWLTSPRYSGGRQLAGHQGEFARALTSHFPELARLQAKAARFAEHFGERPVAPDLWLISHRGHRFIEAKLPWDSVSQRQIVGLALIARYLRSERPISASVVQLYPDSGTAPNVDGLTRQFNELYRAVRTV
jgi:hypothetical protein